MHFKLSVAKDFTSVKTDCLVVGCFSDQKRWPGALPQACRKQLNELKNSGDLAGNTGESLWLFEPAGLNAKRMLIIGCGVRAAWDAEAFRDFLNLCARQLWGTAAKSASVYLPKDVASQNPAWHASALSRAITTAGYRYSQTLSKPASKARLQRVNLLVESGSGQAQLKSGLTQGSAIGAGINTARKLGDLPANICTPAHLARQARKMAKGEDRVSTQVLEEKQMESLGMGALLSVSRGSSEPAKLITINYRGASKDEAPVVLVGKGITFDSGGISLKPGAKMDEMKYDMCGAASVFGTMQALIALKPAINVIGVVPASENLPSGTATKPGDVVTSMSGTTIEVLNTDAEGRLVLCDALSYAEKFKPRAVVDIATLTGAVIVALGHHNAGLLSNHQPLADDLLQAGNNSGDSAWQLPLDKAYHKQLKSNFADLANIGGPAAGTITAASFLSHFTRDYHWAHLDIAGVAWKQGSAKGATGRPVALLMEYLLQQAG